MPAVRVPARPQPRAPLAAALLLALGGLATATQAAPLTNADFSAGFTGWTGQIIACTILCDGSDDQLTTLTPPPGAATANFATSAATATLTTSFADDDVYEVRLFQTFDVAALGRATALWLHAVLGPTLSGNDDLVVAQLLDPAGLLPPVDLLAGTPTDITAFAGRSAQLLFAVADYDDIADTLTIGGLRIEPVPAPATLLLFATGLGLVASRRRHRAR